MLPVQFAAAREDERKIGTLHTQLPTRRDEQDWISTDIGCLYKWTRIRHKT